MKKLCLVVTMLLASVIITNAQTESNVFIYDMNELYYNSANYDQQNKAETSWFTKYGKIAGKYIKPGQYTTTLSGYTLSYKGKDAGVIIHDIAKLSDLRNIKQYLIVYNGQAKTFIEIDATTNTKNSKAAVKVKYTDIPNQKNYTKDFSEDYFIADNYLITLLNELGDTWFSYATQPDTGIKYDKVSDYDQSKKLFTQLLKEAPVGDIFRYQYNGSVYGYTAKVYDNDRYDYIIAGADKKIIVRTGFLADDLKSISFTTLTDNKKHTLKFPEKVYSYMGFMMEYLGKNGYLK